MTDRITEYLSSGGLFNPEMANHDAVRDLLIDCREALAASQKEVDVWREKAIQRGQDATEARREADALRASLALAQEALRCRPAVLPDLDLGYDAATCDNCGKAQVGEEAEEPLCDECWARRNDAASPPPETTQGNEND